MQDFFPQLIQFNIPFIVIILIAGIAAAATILYYRKTNPEIGHVPKYILGGLRGVILIIILLLFFAPKFFFQIHSVIKQDIAVFIDNSLSMGNSEADSARWNSAVDTYANLKNQLSRVGNVSAFTFNDHVQPAESGNLALSQSGTDFSTVIENIKKNGYDKAVIISDGNHTESNYPLPDYWPYETDIFTVGIGNTASGGDLSISRVDFTPVSYVGRTTEIQAEIRTSGETGSERVRVSLKSGNKTIAAKYVSSGSGGNTQTVSFDFTPSQIGLNTYVVEVEALPTEANKRNNRYTVVQNTLRNRVRVGIIGSVPQYETKFLNFILNRIDEVETFTFIEKPDGSFFGKQDQRYLDSLDVMILCGFPGSQTRTNIINKVIQVLKTKQTASVFFLNDHTDLRKLTGYSDFLPLVKLPVKSNRQEIIINPPGGLNPSPLLILFDQSERNTQFWNKLPPVSVNYFNFDLKSGAQTVLNGNYGNKMVPVIITHEDANSRILLFNGEGFWKWHFYFQDNPELLAGYATLLKNMLRWTSDQSKLKPVMLKARRNSGHPGENIPLKGFLYDGQFQLVDHGSMVVEARWNDQKFEIETRSDSSGSFDIQFIPPGEGRYTLVAKGYRDDVSIGEDRIEMEIIPLEKELIRTTQNVDFLKKTAGLGNGKYFNVSAIDSVLPAMHIADKMVVEDKTIEIWYHPVLLGLILLLITVEWIIRKRLGLI